VGACQTTTARAEAPAEKPTPGASPGGDVPHHTLHVQHDEPCDAVIIVHGDRMPRHVRDASNEVTPAMRRQSATPRVSCGLASLPGVLPQRGPAVACAGTAGRGRALVQCQRRARTRRRQSAPMWPHIAALQLRIEPHLSQRDMARSPGRKPPCGVRGPARCAAQSCCSCRRLALTSVSAAVGPLSGAHNVPDGVRGGQCCDPQYPL
jgi:hypothetical protein